MKNKIVESLKSGPKTISELPYAPSAGGMGITTWNSISKLKVTGRRSKTVRNLGIFKTVYYMNEDIDEAINKFIEVNQPILQNLKSTQHIILTKGMPAGIGEKILTRFNNRKLYKLTH